MELGQLGPNLEVVDPRPEAFENRILWSRFLTENPGSVIIWAYLAFSFALGSLPSRQDLSSVSALVLLFALAALLLSFFREASESTLLLTLAELSARAVGIYALPVAVTITAALFLGYWG